MENAEKSGRDWSDVVNDLDMLGLEIREMGSVAFLMIEAHGLGTPEQGALSLASRRLEELSKRQGKLTKELSQMMSGEGAGAA